MAAKNQVSFFTISNRSKALVISGILPLGLAFGLLSCGSSNKVSSPAAAKSKAEAKVVMPNQQVSTPADVHYVYDYEEIFSQQEEHKIDSLLRNFERSNLIPIIVATINDPAITTENFEKANKALLNEWSGVHGKSDKCMTISISKSLRYISIDFGPFVNKLLSREEVRAIVDNSFNPSFKQDQYFQGTLNGLEALMNTIRKNIRF